MKYTTNDGQVYEAKDAFDFIKKLKDSSRSGEGINLRQFQKEVAARVLQDTGHKVSIKTADKFLFGLVKAGVVKVETS